MKPAITNALSILLVAGSAMAATADTTRTPVLLELFTSEGCSSCPPADKLLQSLDRTQPVPGVDIIVLSEHVDYWNNLGWTDPFSSADYTQRQRQYSEHFQIDSIYTPQLVIDGSKQIVGSDAPGARSAIQQVAHQSKLPLTLSTPVRDGNHVNVHIDVPANAAQGSVYVALAENRTESHVARGENSGHLLTHVAVVRKLIKVGAINQGDALTKDIQLPLASGAGVNGLRVIAFVQDARTGHILGAAQQKLEAAN